MHIFVFEADLPVAFGEALFKCPKSVADRTTVVRRR